MTPRVSDHAVVRYLERVEGKDINAVRAKIVTPRVAAALGVLPTCHVIQGGHRLVVRDGMVTTVIERK
jgi:uncharacterized membrane protein